MRHGLLAFKLISLKKLDNRATRAIRTCLEQARATTVVALVASAPSNVPAQEFLLDRQTGTCSQLDRFVDVNGVKDGDGNRHPTWLGVTNVHWLVNGFRWGTSTSSGGPSHNNDDLRSAGFGDSINIEIEHFFRDYDLSSCWRLKRFDLTFAAEIAMSRIEWDHKWPPDSPCAKEWQRAVQSVQVHERKHAQIAREMVAELNGRFSQRQDFRVGCGSSKDDAAFDLKRNIARAVEEELQRARAEFDRKTAELDQETANLDCSKCKSYSFQGLRLQYRVVYDLGIPPADFILTSSGAFCGNPRDTKWGYIDIALSPPLDKSRLSWEGFTLAPKFHYWFDVLPGDPLRIEMTWDGLKTGMHQPPWVRLIPTKVQKAQSPLSESEEPQGCEPLWKPSTPAEPDTSPPPVS